MWLAVSASADSVAQRLMALLGVGDDERFTTFPGRMEHRDELDALLTDWIARRPASEVLAAFEAAEAAIAPVYSIADLAADPHVVARGAIVDVDGTRMAGPVARLSRTPGRIRHAGRALGADTASVLAELAEGDRATTPGAPSGHATSPGAPSGRATSPGAPSGRARPRRALPPVTRPRPEEGSSREGPA